MEVLDGSPVSEVAVRYGVSRQSVYTWRDRYAAGGIDGLRDASRRPRTSPSRLAAEIEALVCELRRAHPRWGARRIAFEVAQRGVAAGAVAGDGAPGAGAQRRWWSPQAQRHKRKYRRWQRETPMALWQLDLVGGIYLADGRECKLLSGIDDHSRFVVCAAVLAVPSGRAVADAFTAAMRTYGVPAEVLTDNGKQFTGRFTKPRPAEVLFERVCREHGITAKLTRPVLADHDREGGAVAPDAAPRAARRWPGRSRTCPPRRPRSAPGCTPTTTPGRTRRWTWPRPASLFRPGVSARTGSRPCRPRARRSPTAAGPGAACWSCRAVRRARSSSTR